MAEETHRIKIKIADRDYYKTISSQDEEARIRRAATSLNESISILQRGYPGASVIDIVTIAALNEIIAKEQLRDEEAAAREEASSLAALIKDYVDNLK